MFWSTETLKAKLPDLIPNLPDDAIRRANCTLRVGPEIYVTPSEKPTSATEHAKISLGEGQGFAIPPGQFAFLLTEEFITVPTDALAFISIRAKYKFRGLVNVSGFHVDPEFQGWLLFSVFNAGPSPISLRRGEQCFHIWYASLDAPCTEGTRPGYEMIESDLIQPLGRQLHSFEGLNARIDSVVNEQRISRVLLGVAIPILAALLVAQLSSQPPQAPIVIQQPVEPVDTIEVQPLPTRTEAPIDDQATAPSEP